LLLTSYVIIVVIIKLFHDPFQAKSVQWLHSASDC